MKLMLDCRALARLLSHWQEKTPPLAMRARMRLHLMTCHDCRTVDEQVRFVRHAMQTVRASTPTDVPAGERTL